MLSVGAVVDREIMHAEPKLPSWHPCCRPHAHHYRITLELREVPQSLMNDEAQSEWRVAVGLLDEETGPLRHGVYVGDLPGILGSGNDDLAFWTYQWITAALPPLAPYLHVTVEIPGRTAASPAAVCWPE